MTERPILFTAPMVVALRERRKTQTRRIIDASTDHATRLVNLRGGVHAGRPRPRLVTFDLRNPRHLASALDLCPYGLAGDQLWVREALERSEGAWLYASDRAPVVLPEDDPRVPVMLSWAHHKPGRVCPSIHMPRWASRITLKIESVRAERVQDIDAPAAMAEGIGEMLAPGHPLLKGHEHRPLGARDVFALLWDEMNGARASWEANPWVWVLGFKVIEPAGGVA